MPICDCTGSRKVVDPAKKTIEKVVWSVQYPNYSRTLSSASYLVTVKSRDCIDHISRTDIRTRISSPGPRSLILTRLSQTCRSLALLFAEVPEKFFFQPLSAEADRVPKAILHWSTPRKGDTAKCSGQCHLLHSKFPAFIRPFCFVVLFFFY